MTLSAHQPAYLPWLGYFNKIARADVFVILDDVQYEKNSFINRNRIKTPQGVQWLTIPVHGGGRPLIKDAQIAGDRWRGKHWKAIEQNYRKAPCFEEFADTIKEVYCLPPPYLWTKLKDVLYPLAIMLKSMGFEHARICEQSDIGVGGHKQELILNLCKHFGADRFLFGSEGRGYADVEWFRERGIEIEFQDYHTPEYPQLYGEFVPDLSVVDALFNVGAEETRRLICES